MSNTVTKLVILRRQSYCFLNILVLLLCALPSQGQPLGGGTDRTFNAYEVLVDEIFPRSAERASGVIATLVVRFLPSSKPEARLVIHFRDDGSTIEYSRVLEQLQRTLQKAGRVNQERLSEIENTLPVRRGVKSIDSSASKRLLEELWEALAKSPPEIGRKVGTIQLDGTRYELELVTGLVTLSLAASDVEVSERAEGDLPIVKWVNALRLQFE